MSENVFWSIMEAMVRAFPWLLLLIVAVFAKAIKEIDEEKRAEWAAINAEYQSWFTQSTPGATP